MNEQWLLDTEKTLTHIAANILQISHEESSKLAKALVVKSAGAAGVAGIFGLVSTFGAASTGTAIAGLSGAAATNATLYWVGSIVGGGMLAGSIITGGIGIAVGYYALKTWKGEPRSAGSITKEENILIDACYGLARALHEQRQSKQVVKESDALIFYEKAWIPFIRRVKEYEAKRARDTLNLGNYVGLGQRVLELDKLKKELEAWLS